MKHTLYKLKKCINSIINRNKRNGELERWLSEASDINRINKLVENIEAVNLSADNIIAEYGKIDSIEAIPLAAFDNVGVSLSMTNTEKSANRQ